MQEQSKPRANEERVRESEPESARTVVLERTYDVPASVLFLANSRPEHVLRWFGPPGYPLTMCEMDFRVGGRFRFAMTGPEGVQQTPFGGEYLEIVPNERIVFTNSFEEEGSPVMVMTWFFDEVAPGRTRLRMQTVFESVAMKDDYLGQGFEQGAGAGLEQLEAIARGVHRSG